MAKEAGTGWTTFSLDDEGGTARAIKNDVTNFDFSTPINLQDVTGVDSSAMERLTLLSDFQCNFNGVFNDASDTGIWDVLSTAPSTVATRTLTLAVSGQTLANETLISDVNWTRAADGSLTVAATVALQDGTVPTWS